MSAEHPHEPWCDQPHLERHTSCGVLLGTVPVTSSLRLDLRLTRHIDTPAVLSLKVADHGRDRVIALNVERAHELETLVRRAVALLLGRPDEATEPDAAPVWTMRVPFHAKDKATARKLATAVANFASIAPMVQHRDTELSRADGRATRLWCDCGLSGGQRCVREDRHDGPCDPES